MFALFAAVFFVFMFVFFLALIISDIVKRRNDIRRRASIQQALHSEKDEAPEQEWERMSRSLRFQSSAPSISLLAKVEQGQKRIEVESESSKAKRELISAGFFGEGAVAWYQAIRYSLTFSLPLAVYLALGYFEFSLTPAFLFLTVMGSLAAGYFLPARYLARRQNKLKQQCSDGFPDFMDLMVICAEAGLSPRAAIDRISREIAITYPYLGANIYLASLELRAGNTLAVAIQNLANRINLEEVARLGVLLQQTEELGTSIGDALRVYSDEMRDKRLSKAEEKAYSLPVRLTLPLGFYVFPVMLVVIALPVFIRIKNALF
ncbi:MAG: type II secretion system F family protein [Alphaproteobacteria bacterium]